MVGPTTSTWVPLATATPAIRPLWSFTNTLSVSFSPLIVWSSPDGTTTHVTFPSVPSEISKSPVFATIVLASTVTLILVAALYTSPTLAVFTILLAASVLLTVPLYVKASAAAKASVIFWSVSVFV